MKRRPVAKAKSSPRLCAPLAEDSAQDAIPGSPFVHSTPLAAFTFGLAARSSMRSMPLLPRTAARLSLSVDFPAYPQLLLHTNSARSAPRINPSLPLGAPSLSANYDPSLVLALLPPPLPPGYSLGSLVGGQRPDSADAAPPARSMRSLRASVDGAAAAKVLRTSEPDQSAPASPMRPDLHGSCLLEDINDDSDPFRMPAPTPAPTPAPVRAPVSALYSSRSLPLPHSEWCFDSNLQRERLNARFAAMDATEEIRYEEVYGSSNSSNSNGCHLRTHSDAHSSVRGSGSGSLSRIITAGNKKPGGGGGGAWKLLMALAARAFRVTHGAAEDDGGGRAGVRTCSREKAVRLSVERGRSDPEGVDGWQEEGREAVSQVTRSRDSWIIHRARLGLDGVGTRKKGRNRAVLAAPLFCGDEREDEDEDDVNAAVAAAASAFTVAASAVSICGNVAATAAAEVAADRRVWFRRPMVDAIHWLKRSRDYRNASGEYFDGSEREELFTQISYIQTQGDGDFDGAQSARTSNEARRSTWLSRSADHYHVKPSPPPQLLHLQAVYCITQPVQLAPVAAPAAPAVAVAGAEMAAKPAPPGKRIRSFRGSSIWPTSRYP